MGKDGPRWITAGIAGLVACAVFGWWASGHAINPDEGFYLAAADRVARGERIYRDFFFPQMPMLPWIEAFLVVPGSESLLVHRAVSYLPAAILAGVVASQGTGRSSWLVGITAAAALVFHTLALNYFTVVKTYGLSTLAAVVAFLFAFEPKHPWQSVVAGAAIGLAAAARLPMVAVGAVLTMWIGVRTPRMLPAFIAGAVAVLLPAVWVGLADPDSFWFGNFGFHGLRTELSTFEEVARQKIAVLARWVLLPQNFVVWVAAIVGAWIGGTRERLALLTAGVLGAAYLSATPTYLEYTVQLLPFLLLAGIPAIALVLAKRTWFVLGIAVYAIGLIVSLRSPESGSDRARKMDLWNRERVESVTDFIAAHTGPGDRVLSWWEGYPVLAGRDGFRGVGFWESNMGRKLDDAQRRRFHILDRDEVADIVRKSEAALVVFPEGEWEHVQAELASRYSRAAEFGALQLWQRTAGSDRVL